MNRLRNQAMMSRGRRDVRARCRRRAVVVGDVAAGAWRRWHFAEARRPVGDLDPDHEH